jgi:hypothetical protein
MSILWPGLVWRDQWKSVYRIRGQESDTGEMLCCPTAPHCKPCCNGTTRTRRALRPCRFQYPMCHYLAIERSKSSPLTPPLEHCTRNSRDQCSHTSGLYSLSNLMRPGLPGSADINNSACISHLGMDLPALRQIIASSLHSLLLFVSAAFSNLPACVFGAVP